MTEKPFRPELQAAVLTGPEQRQRANDLPPKQGVRTEEVEVERDENDTEGSTFIDMRVFGRLGSLKIFELDKESLEIRQARIVSKRLRDGSIIRMLERRPGCRYVEARNYSEADRKFIEMITGKRYSEVKKDIKRASLLAVLE